jgi:positive regulator of sigma E activity
MFKETVIVSEVWEDKVKISFVKKQMCSHCKTKSFCGNNEESIVIDSSGFSLHAGDKIEIAIEEKKTILASIIVFLIPAVLFIGCLVSLRQYGESFSFFFSLVVLGVYYLLLRVIMRTKGSYFKINILRKL